MQDSEIKDLEAGSFSLDFPEMSLSRVFNGKVNRICGAGYLRQNGLNFELKVFAKDPAANRALFVENMKTPAGSLLGSETFFNLAAVDESGRAWKGEDILLDGAFAGPCISGRCSEVLHERNLQYCGRDAMALTFFQPLKLPGTTTFRTEQQVGEEEPFLQSIRRICKFNSCGLSFDVGEKPLWTRLHVTADKGRYSLECLPEKITEALEFCRGEELRPAIVEKLADGYRSWALSARGTRVRTSSNRQPPLPLKGDEFFLFFEAILQKLLLFQGKESKRAPIAAIHQYLIQMNNAAIDVRALALGVAVEALLKAEFGDLGAPADPFLSDLDKVAAFVSESDLATKSKDRLSGTLNAMRDRRAKDILFELRDGGAIDSSRVKAWVKLRNKSAHAEAHHYDQDFVNLCGTVRVLWHHLLFLAIGYKGIYLDYAVAEWPKKEFSGEFQSSEEEE